MHPHSVHAVHETGPFLQQMAVQAEFVSVQGFRDKQGVQDLWGLGFSFRAQVLGVKV